MIVFEAKREPMVAAPDVRPLDNHSAIFQIHFAGAAVCAEDMLGKTLSCVAGDRGF